MTGQLRRCTWAILLLGSTMANANVDVGSVQIQLNSFTHVDTFQWNSAPDRATYEHKSQVLNFDLKVAGTGAMASGVLEQPTRLERDPNRITVDLVQFVQVLKKEARIELQWNVLVSNPKSDIPIPMIIVNRLKLHPKAKWTDFEKGGVIEAVIDDETRNQVSGNLISDLAEYIYNERLRSMVEMTPVQGYVSLEAQAEPIIYVNQIGPRVVKFSKTQITVTTTAANVEMEPRIFGIPVK